MTGAASDSLSSLLGSDDGCCGYDAAFSGGCGKCVLVQNPSAINSDMLVLVMKKNRCPPWSSGCSGGPHLDFAAPGFDNLQYSTANICGQQSTFIGQSESSVCGNWYNYGSSTIAGCSCSSLPEST